MKRNISNPLFGLFISMLIISGCGTSNLYMDVLKPAYVTVPRDIQSLVIINRSLPDDDNKVANIFEGIITGEGVFVDKYGSEECIRGLAQALQGSERYPKVYAPTDIDLKAKGAGQMPPLLDWKEVKHLCAKYKADALVTLASFDSDNDVKFRKVAREVEKNGRKVMVNDFVADFTVRVTSGWRIYYPKNEIVVDANRYTDYQSWEAVGPSEKGAVAKLPSMHDAVGETGYFSGKQYARRISPTWIKVGRMYYTKGNDDFEKATRYVQQNDWEEAADLWARYTDDSDPKLAGKACYNVALSFEMEGDLEGALEWAKKSYYDFNNKKALPYVRILTTRINDQKKLKEQLGD